MPVFLLILGFLLLFAGAMLVLASVPFTSWGASWADTKAAFRIMVRSRRFQAGAVCVIAGFLLVEGLFFPFII